MLSVSVTIVYYGWESVNSLDLLSFWFPQNWFTLVQWTLGFVCIELFLRSFVRCIDGDTQVFWKFHTFFSHSWSESRVGYIWILDFWFSYEIHARTCLADIFLYVRISIYLSIYIFVCVLSHHCHTLVSSMFNYYNGNICVCMTGLLAVD